MPATKQVKLDDMKPKASGATGLKTNEKVFFVFGIVVIPLILCAFYECVTHVRAMQELEPDYMTFSELAVSAMSTLTFLAASSLFRRHIGLPLGEMVIAHKSKWTPILRRKKVERFAACIFKFIYFATIAQVGWRLLRGQEWTPSELGGNGIVSKSWDDPLPELQMRLYYLVSLGYHIYCLISHVWLVEHRNDFVEMLLHHLVTVVLVSTSYYGNYYRMGALILFIHDVPDLFVYAAKCLVDTKHTVPTLVMYFGMLVSWAYMRLYVLPTIIIPSCLKASRRFPVVAYTVPLLTLLFFMHIYWYCMFLHMGYTFVSTGKAEDSQQMVVDPTTGASTPTKHNGVESSLSKQSREFENGEKVHRS